MTRLFITALILLTASLGGSAHAAEAKVVPFVKKGVDPLIVLNITSLVASELDFMGTYDDVEQLDDYPSGYSLSCLSKTSCMGTVGKALGTDFVLGGSVASSGSTFDVYMVLFDVNRGTFVRKKTFKVDKAPEKMADSMGAYVQELVTGKSRAQVQEESSVASADDFALEEDDFEDLDFDFDDGNSSSRVSTPGNSDNSLDDFEEAEDPAYEARRAEEERRRAEQQRREDDARRAEEERRAEEQRQREEEQRRADEERRREDERRAEEERQRQAEEKRRADEERARQKEDDKRRKEAEKQRKEDERRVEEQARRDREAADEAERSRAQEDAVVDEYDYDSGDSDDFDDISFGSSVSVDEIEFGSSVSAEEEPEEEAPSRSRYEDLDDEDSYDEDAVASDDDPLFDDDYYDDLDSFEPSERQVAEARGSDRYDDDRSSRYDDDDDRDRYDDDRNSGSSGSRTGSRSGSSSATISGTFVPHDPRVGITARAGYSRYQNWNFLSYGAEVSIPVSDTIYVQIGLAGYSVNRDVPEELQEDFGSDKIWNTIVPFNLGFIYQATKSNIRPYGGVDLTLTPYTRTFKVAIGARARIGVDFMIAETFGINLNTGLGVWYGSDFDVIEEGVSEFGFIPSINAGTVLKF